MKTMKIEKIGNDDYNVYIDNRFITDIAGIKALHRIVDETFNLQPKQCFNLPLDMLTPCGVGKITSSWEDNQNIGRIG